MNTDIEDLLIAGMHERVGGITLTTDVLAGAGRRHQRRTAIRRTAYAAGVLGLAGALGITATTGGGAPRSQTPPAVAGAESANLRLAAAIAASENISYRVSVSTHVASVPGSPDWTAEGAFDPTKATGYLRAPYTEGPGFREERLINGVRYAGDAGGDKKVVWQRYPGKQNKLNYDGALSGTLGASADPASMLAALRQAGATITDNGAGGFHFSVKVKTPGAQSDALTGDVTLDGDKRIAKVSYQRTIVWVKNGKAQSPVDLRVTLRLSDYGKPVEVTKPTV